MNAVDKAIEDCTKRLVGDDSGTVHARYLQLQKQSTNGEMRATARPATDELTSGSGNENWHRVEPLESQDGAFRVKAEHSNQNSESRLEIAIGNEAGLPLTSMVSMACELLQHSRQLHQETEVNLGSLMGKLWAESESNEDARQTLCKSFKDGDSPTFQEIAIAIDADPCSIFGDQFAELSKFCGGGFVSGALKVCQAS